jgi:hypothetical protein
MSYAGGTVTQPILGGFDDLTKMLLQGSSEIAQINLQVDKKRNEQMSDLTEQISKITSTGITQHDKLIQQGARDRVNRLAAGFEATKRGEMTLSQNAAQKGQYQTEMSILANMSKLQDENLKSVYKNIEDGKYDSISGDQANTFWYNNPGDKKDVYSSPAVNPDGTPKIVGGKQQYVRRPSIEGLQVQDINGVLNVVKIKEVPKRDPQTGDPIVIDGVTQTINKTFYQPLTEALDPSKKYVKKYDLVKDVKDFQSITGTRVSFVDKNGNSLDNPYVNTGTLPSGSQLLAYQIAPENFPDMIRGVEEYIGKTSDDDVISIIHSFMGGKADFQPDYEPPRSKKETNESMMMDVVVGGETTTLPRYYDMNGNVLKFTSDPLDLQTDSKGKIQITNEQRALAKAFKRDKMLKSFNVTYKDYKDHLNNASSSRTPPTGISFASATYASQVLEEIGGEKTGKVLSINKNTPIDQSYIQGKIAVLAKGRAEFSTGTNVSANDTRDLIAKFSQGIVPEPTLLKITGSMKVLNDRSQDVIGGFSLVAEGKSNKPGGDVISKITQDLKGTTASGGKLISASNVLVFEQGTYKVDEKDKKTAPMVVIQGKIDLASTTFSDSILSKQGGSSAMSVKQSIAVDDFYIVESGTELRSLYTKLWEQGNAEGSFRKVLEDKGYNIKGIMKGGSKPDLLGAFEAYTNIINN